MTITLTKDMGAADLDNVSKMTIGAAWDTSTGGSGRLLGAIKKRIGTDLDVVAVAMQGPDPVRMCGLDNLDPFGNGSMVHSGDNHTGHGEGDDETIDVVFANVPPNVTGIVFIVAAFKRGSAFGNAQNVSFNVYDSSDGVPGKVADIWPSLMSRGNACAVAKAERAGNSWTLEVVNKMGTVTQGDQFSLMRFAISQ
ncbi:stress protein [Streptomyces nigrescens]|uniref:Stress protein n=1 Tax=Streptomyces nigrescens TaxID=1920 RepID=A0ABM7ZW36_STRNI|nr:TerD family protein [Streptomyces nigrescens]BDM70553.1 stress protein [Streptomyces nigrescens]